MLDKKKLLKIKRIAKKKFLVILGPTASGKTKLAVDLARQFNGEIISADSRQVYKGMDIGTGKDLNEYGQGEDRINYHLIDVVNPDQEFNLAKYQKLANNAIKKIISLEHLPILVGGTGLYLQAIVDNYILAPFKPDLKKRAFLEKMTVTELYRLLEKEKPEFAHKLNNSDKNNPRRLVRYLEIISQENDIVNPSYKLSEKSSKDSSKGKGPQDKYDFLILGLLRSDEEMKNLIIKRIKDRLDREDMVDEVRNLQKNGLSWKRLQSFGLEYRFISNYLQEKISYEEMIEKLATATYRFAKRQKTWFKRWEKQGRKINWIRDNKEGRDLVNRWLFK